MIRGNNCFGYEVVDSDNKLNSTEHAVNIAEVAMAFDEQDWQKKTKKNRRKSRIHSLFFSCYH